MNIGDYVFNTSRFLDVWMLILEFTLEVCEIGISEIKFVFTND